MAKTITILHVDDEPDVAELTTTFLEREDDRFAVRSATSPQEGPDVLAEKDIDCIVSDYEMPHTDGIEFLELVREDYPNLPFILYTGKGSEEVASEAISAGVTDYLQKGGPERYELLANRIRNVVSEYQVSHELEVTRERYGRILEHASDFIMIVGESGEVSYVSPALTRVLGYEQNDVIGVNAFDYVHPDDMEKAADSLAETVANPEQEVTLEYRAEHADGGYHWVEVRGGNFLDDPVIEGILVNVRDITARKEREVLLQRERSRLNALFENSSDSIVFTEFVDGEPLIRDVNDAFVETFGYDKDEAIGHTIDELVVPDETDKAQEATELNRRIEAGERVVAEVRRQTQDGVRDFLLQSTPLEPGERNIETYVTYSDITERKEREVQLQRQNERLEAFTSVVSHDLYNPLNVASGRLEMAQDDCDSEHLIDVDHALDRMETLIENILELSRHGESVGERESITLAALVESCWANVETTDATFDADIAMTINADKSRLKQIFENLFRNAVEHGGEGVTVTVGELDDGFYIEDDGPGIPDAEREDIFEAGYSTNDDGTGFGLSIVKEITEAHGWEMTVAEGAEGGARFEITGVK